MIYDLVVVGTGFASSFFLKRVLSSAPSNFRVLVLERGEIKSHSWQRKKLKNSEISTDSTFISIGDIKKWNFSLGFGGSSKCWSGCVPRMLPNDFRLKSSYGVGADWPISYDELEPYYTLVEHEMKVSGPTDYKLSKRSQNFPLPPHKFNEPDKALKKAYPLHYYEQATARPSIPTPNRAPCCSSNVCDLCPMDAKFTVLNTMQYVYNDERVTLEIKAEVQAINEVNGIASKVTFLKNGEKQVVKTKSVALGANGIFNPFILMKSGFKHPYLGRYLNEQVSKTAHIDLDGLENFSGSTLITGQGYMFYDTDSRKDHAGCILEHFNRPILRNENGKWRNRMELKFIFEDLPSYDNYIDASGDKPKVIYKGYSSYAEKGLAQIERYIKELSGVLPIEKYYISKNINKAEAHIQGTVKMGKSVEDGVVNKYGQLFTCKNVYVLGSSSFPTCPPANPTLTLSALAMLSADQFISEL